MYVCEKCGETFGRDYRKDARHKKSNPPRFCSRSCANGKSFSREAIRKKRLSALRNVPVERRRYLGVCETCGAALKTYGAKKCAPCTRKEKPPEETKEKLRKIMKAKVERGEHVGWQKRPIMSYPERMVDNILREWGYEGRYHVNFPVKKRDLGVSCKACYFLDFYFPEYNLDLEIDGKQHLREEVKKKDVERDGLLMEAGYRVARLAWKGNHTAETQAYLVNALRCIIEEAKRGVA